MAQLFKQLTIAGVGLIGGSLAMVAKRDGLVGRIVGLGRTQANLDVALERGMLDAATRDPAQAARGADLLMLAVPILTMRATLERMLPYLAQNAVITDVGSVKGWVVRELEPVIPAGMTLVAAHPVAGKETVGAVSADPELFRGRRVIITPSAKSTADAIARVEALWTATGAEVERMDADLHDAIMARASHLPQVVASALAAALAEERVGGMLALEFGASGLRDTTRLAGSSWEMWRDIFITNRDAIVAALKLFGSTIEEFQELIETGDSAALEHLFKRGRAIREKLK
ncbi:MAG TPA: prephenate dehydrogenase/arogenate dehydrogenase family protein [Candidatus Binataceae bacterium]|nr:prephenate dehydrogenase/arogenate dehydrogenase family protein [Candidatus Binataceae bacterium]